MPTATLKLRRATVVEVRRAEGPEQDLLVALDDGSRRPAIADVGLIGFSQAGDEVIVNVQARDLGLGSGGFDIVHVNLSKGLDGAGMDGAHVMKLNYTSLQHAVEPVEDTQTGAPSRAHPEGRRQAGDRLQVPLRRAVAVLALHGQLAAVAWAFAQATPGRRLAHRSHAA
jgi:Protein of unknown function (DUF3866)